MECDLIDYISGTIVVLNRLLTPNIKDFDDFVGAAGSDASAIRVEFDTAYARAMVMEDTDI